MANREEAHRRADFPCVESRELQGPASVDAFSDKCCKLRVPASADVIPGKCRRREMTGLSDDGASSQDLGTYSMRWRRELGTGRTG